MDPKFDVQIIIEPKGDTASLYGQMEKYNASITKLGENVYVNARLNTFGDEMEHFIRVCREYGDLDIKARMTRSHYQERR